MAELTQTEIEAIITSIDAQLAVLIAAPERMVDYSAGTKSFNNSQRFNGLMKMREYYQNLLNAIPAETYARLAFDTDETGVDQTDYLGDEGE